MNKIYTIENIDCASCAAKIERLIGELPEIQEVTLTFATKQLRVTAENPDALIPQMTKLANMVENGVTIEERTRKTVRRMPERTVKSEDCSVEVHGHDSPDHNSHGQHRHDHDSHSAGCCEGHNRKKITALQNIALGTMLFAVGLVMLQTNVPQLSQIGSLVAFVVAYLVLGGKILLTAVKNIGRGQVFDENFLMSIATIGAFAIQEYPEAVGVMLFFRVGEYFEEKAVERSRSQIMEAVDLRPEVVTLISQNELLEAGGKEADQKAEKTWEIPAEKAQIGDILLVRPGDRIPLDGIVAEGESRIDTSPITGEPVPIKVTVNSKVVSGCINTSGVLKIKVEKTLEESMVTRILDSVENAAASKPRIDKFITRFARIYTPFVVVLALLTAVIPSMITGNWEHWIYTALTFLVISCPCALVLSVPLAFFSGIGAGSKQGILFKGGVALEALKTVKAVVMDKTGTITKGEFVVQKITCSGELINLMTSGALDRPAGISKKDIETYLLSIAASCELNSTHPIGVSVVDTAKKMGIPLEQPRGIEELAGRGIKARLSQGVVLCGNRKLLEENEVDLSGYENNTFGSEVLIAINNKFVGAVTIADTIKPESPKAIEKLKNQGIMTAMLTGDGEESANAVARDTGIEKVFAKLLPQDKLEILREIRKGYGKVMFVGDGINDAPVLAGADVGAAMGSGADAAIEAADVVFMTSSLEAIPKAIAIAKITNKIAIQNVVFALGIKAIVMVLGLAGIASMWMAVFADSGVAMLCVLNSVRILYKKS